MIQRAIETAFHDRTLIVIAHRLGTLRHADIIIEMKDGRVAQLRNRKPEVVRKSKPAQPRTLGRDAFALSAQSHYTDT